jgi:hypothetical protein
MPPDLDGAPPTDADYTMPTTMPTITLAPSARLGWNEGYAGALGSCQAAVGPNQFKEMSHGKQVDAS